MHDKISCTDEKENHKHRKKREREERQTNKTIPGLEKKQLLPKKSPEVTSKGGGRGILISILIQ